jgi:hypothetical protein
MARDKKASFKFSTISASMPGTLGSAASTDKLSTTITFTGSANNASGTYSDVFSTPNMILADAANFTAQADTAASGSSDLTGVNGQNQSLFVKIILTAAGVSAGNGTFALKVVGANASTVSSGKLSDASLRDVTASVPVTVTAAGSQVVYLPLMTSKPYLQIIGTGALAGSGTVGGTLVVSMAGIVNGRDGSVSL